MFTAAVPEWLPAVCITIWPFTIAEWLFHCRKTHLGLNCKIGRFKSWELYNLLNKSCLACCKIMLWSQPSYWYLSVILFIWNLLIQKIQTFPFLTLHSLQHIHRFLSSYQRLNTNGNFSSRYRKISASDILTSRKTRIFFLYSSWCHLLGNPQIHN